VESGFSRKLKTSCLQRLEGDYKEQLRSMKISREEFLKIFPKLAEELADGTDQVEISAIRSDTKIHESAASAGFQNYSPGVIDFLRRCDNEEEGLEVIEYLVERDEISSEYAESLRTKLRTEGIRSIGQKKEDDYYLKKAGY